MNFEIPLIKTYTNLVLEEASFIQPRGGGVVISSVGLWGNNAFEITFIVVF